MHNKVLITVPLLSLPGGVTELFNLLKLNQYESIEYFEVNFLKNKLNILFLPFVYLLFILRLPKIKLVHLNPSLNAKSFYRDMLFAFIAKKLFKKKTIVYWHGWKNDFEDKIKHNIILRFIMNHTFLKADASIVLGSIFKDKLIDLGYRNKIYVETNSAENKFITETIPKVINKNEKIRLLFLSRLEISKGIYIAIETLNLLNKLESRFILIIAGSGSEEMNVRHLISQYDNIEWAGYVINENKHNLLNKSHLMFLPSYGEGLPLTLLEAMMYGIPIVSRPIGGIPDIVKNNENGCLTESLLPEDYCKIINDLVEKPYIYRQMSQNNIEKSKVFEPQTVRERIYKIYEDTHNE